MRYTVELHKGDLAVRLTEEHEQGGASTRFVDKTGLEERAKNGLQYLVQTYMADQNAVTPAPPWGSKPQVVLSCSCGSPARSLKPEDPAQHDRDCIYRIGRAILDGQADKI
jgi:hypothetical protein